MFLLKKLLAALILPPTGPVLLALAGLWLTGSANRRRRIGGRWLAGLSLLALLILSLPPVGNALMARLETYPPVTGEQLRRAQAIVVLGGGAYYAPEYGGETVGAATLERLRYGARLARAANLPLLVTGGAPFGGKPEAEAMRESLAVDFGVKARWMETGSRDTAENASLSAPLLKAAGVSRIALVSHAWHLPRAVPLFEKQGLEVIPTPTVLTISAPLVIADFLPGGLGQSRLALNEYLGQLYNRLKELP